MALDVASRDREGLPLVCLASGVDSLYLSGRTELSPAFLDELAARRAAASENGAAVPGPDGWDGWRVEGRGLGKYRFCLVHDRGRLGVTPSEDLPALRFQPLAEALHGIGPWGVVDWIGQQAASVLGPVRWSVSRVDLFSDWQGWTLEGDDRHHFVCRAEARKTYEEAREFTGFEFGNRSSGTFSARIYDKTLDVKGKGTDWWLDVWGEAFDADRQVHRVEFEINREAIRQFGLDTPAEVLDGAPSLWSYATHEWLTYRTATADQIRSRWPVAPEWTAIQTAPIGGSAIGLDRVLDGRRKGSIRRLMPLLNGCAASFAALTGNGTIDEACAALPAALRDYELVSGRRFADRVQDRLEERRAG